MHTDTKPWDQLSATQYTVAASIGAGLSDAEIVQKHEVTDLRGIVADIVTVLGLPASDHAGNRLRVQEEYAAYAASGDDVRTTEDSSIPAASATLVKTNSREIPAMDEKAIGKLARKLAKLTPTRRNTARCVAEGFDNANIATALKLGKATTASAYVSKLMQELGLDKLELKDRRPTLAAIYKAMPPVSDGKTKRGKRKTRKAKAAKPSPAQKAPRRNAAAEDIEGGESVKTMAAICRLATELTQTGAELAKLITPKFLRELARAEKILKAAAEK